MTAVRQVSFVSIYTPLLALFFLLATPLAAWSQQAFDLDRLLQGSIDAYGGEARLKALATLKLSGTIASKGQAQPGRIDRLFAAPDRLVSVIAYANGVGERRVLVRDQAWRNGKTASVPEHLAMSLQLARQRLPLLLAENRQSLTDLGERAQAGRRFRLLALDIAEGVSLSVLIDPTSGLILQTVGRLNLADGTSADFTTIYGDYRRIDGIAIAMREDHFSQGTATGSTVFAQAEINRPLPASAFTP